MVEEKKTAKKKEGGRKKTWWGVLDMQSRQMIVIVVIMLVILSSTLGTYFLIKALNTFEYGGFEFRKEKSGALTFYHAPIIARNADGEISEFTLVLRNDPRDLSDIPIEVDKILISTENTTYLSLNPNIVGCGDAGIALMNMGIFFYGVGVDVKTATIDESFGQENNLTKITCVNSTKENTVIILNQGDENSIKQLTEFCYEINFKDCEILKSTERFMVGVLSHSRGIKI